MSLNDRDAMVVKLVRAIEVIVPACESQIHNEIKKTRTSFRYTAPGLLHDHYHRLLDAIMPDVEERDPPYRALLSNVLRGKIDVDLVLVEQDPPSPKEAPCSPDSSASE
jgi:hypothetical protein